MERLKGMDISDYQRGLNIASLKSIDIKFLLLKLGYGTTITDSCFPYFYGESVKKGFAVGAWFFSLATSEENAVRDAKKALEIANGRELPLGIFMDVETSEQLHLRDSELTAVCKAFCDTIRDAGYRPGVYGSGLTLWAKVGPSYLGDDVLIWEAAWDRSKPYHACDVWQTSETGSAPGYDGPIDTDLCMSERFYSLITGKGEEKPIPIPEPIEQAGAFTLEIPVLKKGDVSNAVMAMQGELLALGYRCGGKRAICGHETADGIFGNVTEESVRSFQRSRNLPDTGEVDHETRKAMLGG